MCFKAGCAPADVLYVLCACAHETSATINEQ